MSTRKKLQNLAVTDGRPMDRAVPPYEPTLEEIRARAYEAYVQRGRIDGFDLDNWLQAENELRESYKKRTD